MRKAYWRCNSGHYYSSLHCPSDGWTFEGCAELMAAIRGAEQRNEALTIQLLIREGAPDKAIKRTIIIEFGNAGAVFDGFLPEAYVIRGEIKKSHKIGPGHL